MNQRIPLPDFLKGLAVILMIQVHIMELFARPEIFQSLIGEISLFLGGVPAAPLFMVVMGYFVIWRSKGVKSLAKRGLQLVVWGIFLNTGLNLHLLIRIANGTYAYDPLRFILGVDILPLAGLSLLVLAFLRLFNLRKFYFYLGLAVIVAVITPYLPQLTKASEPLSYFTAFLWDKHSWSYFPLFPWLAYPLTGAAFYYLQKDVFFRKYQPYFAGGALIVTVLFFSKGVEISTDLTSYYHHGGLFYIWALSFLGVLIYALNLIPQSIASTYFARYLRFMGRNVTATYVFQWLLIGNIATAIYRTQSKPILLLWFIGITLATSLLVLLHRYYRLRKQERLKYRI